MSTRPTLIRRQDIEAEYGLTARQAKRWIAERRISHVHPGGPTSTCYLLTAELDALIAAATSPATQRQNRKPS